MNNTILLVSMKKDTVFGRTEICPAEVGYSDYYEEVNEIGNVEHVENLDELLFGCLTDSPDDIDYIMLGSVIPRFLQPLRNEETISIAEKYNLDTPHDYNRNFNNINRIDRIIKIFKRYCTTVFT